MWGEKVSKSPHNKMHSLINCSHRRHSTALSTHQLLFLFVVWLVVDSIFRHWSLSGWLECLKSQLDPVIKAVPVGADCSLIYTVPIGSCSCRVIILLCRLRLSRHAVHNNAAKNVVSQTQLEFWSKWALLCITKIIISTAVSSTSFR